MRLIDGDALKRRAQKVATEAWKMKLYAKIETTLNQFIDWIDQAKTIEPEQRWIPVTDHLPDEDVPVLVTDDAGGMATVGIDSCGRYEDTGERFWYTSQNVTAWMYTVEPYGGEQE